MPVTKSDRFNPAENSIAMFGRGLSHPARIRILELIKLNGHVKNCQLVKELQLTKSSVSNHIKKMKEADLIVIEYEPNFLKISLNKNCILKMNSFVEGFND